jgi:hypothetical protein
MGNKHEKKEQHRGSSAVAVSVETSDATASNQQQM